MIRHGNGNHVEGGSPLQKRVDADCPIEEAVLGVDVKMNKIRGGHYSNR